MRRDRFLAGACLVTAACASFPELDDRDAYPTPRRGIVVTEELAASRAGERILERGGNAVDAAVAAAFMLAVTFPEAGNLGGGGFAVYVPHSPGEQSLAIDFREAAPAALTPQAFLGSDGTLDRALAQRSALAVGVPGSVAGLYMLHKQAGKLSWRTVVQPAIRQAREGLVGDNLASRLGQPGTRALIEAGGGSQVYYPGGGVPAPDAPLVQAALAETLRRIAEFGPQGFYTGATAEALAAEVQRRGGVMTPADLQDYRAVSREPLRGWFRGKEIITMPPPSSGGIVLLQALSILDGFPLDQERERALAESGGGGGPGISGRAVHWWIEALRRAFADRAEHMGDPDFYPVPTGRLLSPDWIATRRISIGERADPLVGPMPAEPIEESSNTTHLVVLDREGNAVSLTTTLNSGFGTGIYASEVGFFLNNELDDFALQAGTPNQFGLVGSQANALEPGKRPLSSMTPTIVRDGGQAVTMLLGARGGPRIITAVFLTILRTEVYGQTLAEAQRAPRLHQQWSPALTRFEPGWDPLLLQDLRNRGHEVEVSTRATAGLQAIRLNIGGRPSGVADPRSPLAAVVPEGRGVQLSRSMHSRQDERWARALAGEGRALDWEMLKVESAED